MSDTFPTFSAGEISTTGGMDIRLYEITRQGISWFYNSSESDIIYNSRTYVGTEITDAGIKQKGEAVTDDFSITVPSTLPVCLLFRGSPPVDPIKLVMRQIQYGDTVAPIMWLGYITSVKIKDEISSTIVANTQTATLRRKGLRLSYQRECPHALYDTQCRVDPTFHVEPVTITAINGSQFDFTYVELNTSTAPFTKRFTGGFLTFQSGADNEYVEQRGILQHADTTPETGGLIVLGATDGMTVGMTVSLYPGCDRTPNTCLNYFNNINNFGGFPFLPGHSPYDGDPVF